MTRGWPKRTSGKCCWIPHAPGIPDEIVSSQTPADVPFFAEGRRVAAFPPATNVGHAFAQTDSASTGRVDLLSYSINLATYRVSATRPTVVVFNELAVPGW